MAKLTKMLPITTDDLTFPFNFDVRDLVQILRQTAAVTDATWPKRNLGCGFLVDFMLLYLLQFVSSNFW